MAPVTRSRREPKTTESPANKKSKTATPKSDSKKPEKRKATDDATPVAAKKQKATKDAEPKPTPKSEKSTPKSASKEEKKSTQKSVKEDKKDKKEKKEKPAQKKTKEPTPEPEEEDKENDNEEQEEEELDNETQALVENLDGDDDKEEDTEEANKQISTFKKGQDVGKIPKKKTKDGKDGASATTQGGSGKRGVMYLGRIPHGFYEHEIRAYFGQFGEITRLRVVRNKKTGASRHRAFVEFADAEVADIAARTMDKYLLFGHILTAKIVPPAQVHKDLFKGANRRFKVIPWNKMAGKHLEKPLSESQWKGKITKEEQRRAKRAAKLAEMDYEWEAPQLKAPEAKEPALLTAAEEEEPVKAIEAPAAAEEEKTEEKAADAEPEAESKEEEEPKSTRKRAAATPKKAAATPKKAAAATPKAEASTPARATRSTRKTKA
ncbi:hypothetical protein B0T20DRAFT_440488 [Sordaria brevicollis]|uniref:RRM domain-containing protein n=1 Tax=Sordaria brevicollis TaxID=83679 RepID=A0AAE0PBV8_SORBR|nr:hypothetical protein B0T20DRAFT_440488 [Sordaria brevicollis]